LDGRTLNVVLEAGFEMNAECEGVAAGGLVRKLDVEAVRLLLELEI